MPPRSSCACAPVRTAGRDGTEHCRPFDPRSHAPDWLAPQQSDHNPRTNFSVDSWPPRGSTCLSSIELASYEPSVPCQDGVGQGGSRHLAEGLAAQSMSNLAELRSLGVREPQAPLQLGLQDPVFSNQILIP